MDDHETLLARADQARAEAAAATLSNVRDRCLRSAAVWQDMADMAQRTRKMRDLHEEAKAARPPWPTNRRQTPD